MYIYIYINLFIYLAALGLSRCTQDLPCILQDLSLWPKDSPVVVGGPENRQASVVVAGGLRLLCEIFVP